MQAHLSTSPMTARGSTAVFRGLDRRFDRAFDRVFDDTPGGVSFRRGGRTRRGDRHREPRGDSPVFRVGLCTPMRGTAGIWGPSCIASAQLAEAELNRGSGVARRPCELVLVDASDESPEVEDTLRALVDRGEVDALVGMCISSVRQRIMGAVGGRVPFVYTCLYEGGESSPGLFAIGETAERQLRPSIAWLSARNRVKRWMLVGNDYVWPRVSHRIAQECIAESGGEVVAQTYVPFGVDDYSEVLDQLRKSHADAVLISMVGQDAVNFNRAFARAGLAARVQRLSCAIEENLLLAIGAENTENLHVALGYFSSLQTDANLSFKERYRNSYGERAPTLNSIGQSVYEGMHFLATLLDEDSCAGTDTSGLQAPLPYASARTAICMGASANHRPMYLARAEGHSFQVVARF
ncbi:substrate-binding domain-containing protein [soil metagenome]